MKCKTRWGHLRDLSPQPSLCNSGTNPSSFNSKDSMVTMRATFFPVICVSWKWKQTKGLKYNLPSKRDKNYPFECMGLFPDNTISWKYTFSYLVQHSYLVQLNKESRRQEVGQVSINSSFASSSWARFTPPANDRNKHL